MNNLKAILALNNEINIGDLLNEINAIFSELSLSLVEALLFSNYIKIYEIKFVHQLRVYNNKDPCNENT